MNRPGGNEGIATAPRVKHAVRIYLRSSFIEPSIRDRCGSSATVEVSTDRRRIFCLCFVWELRSLHAVRNGTHSGVCRENKTTAAVDRPVSGHLT